MIRYLLSLIFSFVFFSLLAQPNATKPSLRQLQQQIEQLAEAAQGTVGATATLVETGESVSLRGDQPFPMQSVYKMPIGMATLHLVDQGKLSLEQKIQVSTADYISKRQHSPIREKYPNGTELNLAELLRYAVSESDGSASDILMRVIGGPNVIMNYLKSLDVKDLLVVNTEREIGSDNAIQYKNWAKPAEAVALLRRLQEGRGLSKSSRAFLLRLMTETETGLHRLKGQLPAGIVVAHKTGTSWTIDGVTAATNDIGLVTLPNGQHIAIAVFVSDAKADTDTREAVIANISRAVWDYWTKG